MVSDETLKKLQEQIAAWPMTQRFVVQQLIEDYRRNREDLRAYKATGLKPEEVLPKDKADEIALKLMRLADLESLCNYTRLRELAEADKDGRLVVLPCKAGDTVYEVTSRKTISEYRVKAIRVELFCTFIEWDIVAGFVDKSIFGVPVDEIGKTVFLTREEAENALGAMKDD
jgi:hypothetical protein